MKLLKFTIIKLTLYLIIGILLGSFFVIDLDFSIYISIALVGSIGILIAMTKKKFGRFYFLGFLMCLAMVSIGILMVNLHDQKHFKSHYTNYLEEDSDSIHKIQFRIREVLKPGNYYDKYIIDVLRVNSHTLQGKSLLNVKKDSLKAKLNVDDTFIAYTQFKNLIEPLNPHQFNYKNYLKKKYIYHQIFIETHSLFYLENAQNTLFGYIDNIRLRINESLKPYHFKPDQLAIINALLLGQRQDISDEVYKSYTQAGAIHILAISGLHVGIILLILNIIFKPIEYLKNGNYIKIVLLVSLLWAYALIAGLSASAVRAVTMFTVFAIAMNLKRPTNVYNTLSISAFILLLIKPNFIFDVGFQLSYLAVLAIISIEPILSSLWKPPHKFITYFWRIFTVTIAAQFGIIPISLYYFHQLPGLFFISNLVIIPFLGFILGLGLFVIILSLLKILPVAIANAYGSVIELMNNFVGWVSAQDAFLFKHISFSLIHVFLSYLLIITAYSVLKRKTYKSLIFFLFGILITQTILIYDKSSNNNVFTVFHKSRHTVIGIKHKDHLIVHHSLETNDLMSEKLIANYKVGEFTTTFATDSVQSIYKIGSEKLLVIDSLGVYNTKSFHPEIILLRNSPKINLKRVIDSLQPQLVVFDGSNYKSYQERWVETCRAKKIPFHQTSKKGAFIMYF